MTHTDPDAEADLQFDSSFKLLQQLVNVEDANKLVAQRAHTVFTAYLVLWMLVYQRLMPDASLENAEKHLIETRPSYLPDNNWSTMASLMFRSCTSPHSPTCHPKGQTRSLPRNRSTES